MTTLFRCCGLCEDWDPKWGTCCRHGWAARAIDLESANCFTPAESVPLWVLGKIVSTLDEKISLQDFCELVGIEYSKEEK